jgi:hemoglobin/transferrin/lactoferrin receptor protein
MYKGWMGGLAGSGAALALTSGIAAAQGIQLEGIVVTATKTSEAAIEALSGSSAVTKEQLDQQFQADRPSQILRTVPGVTTAESARDTAQAVNIRGLQDFGRVNVLIEGARQNFQRSGHIANGVYYLEPEMLKSIDITRGPTSVIYGSGAIGGVVAFGLLDADDILLGNEVAAARTRLRYASNGPGYLLSETAAAKAGNFDILGQFNSRWNGDYKDGAGNEIADSGDTTKSGFVKTRWRPSAGSQFTVTALDFQSEFIDRPSATSSTRRDSDLHYEQYTLGYTYARPDTPLLDFSAKVYKNRTQLDQRVLFAPFEPVGSRRGFDVDTQGFDVFNTSRFTFGNAKLALTYGSDAFRDAVATFDQAPLGNADDLTPSGRRQVAGAFVQSRLTLFDTVDFISALRYDTYELDGGPANTHLEDQRVSPKFTLGWTPIKGITPFVTYAEGFRAPAITETLISGLHPPAPFPFPLIPNPNLRPEVAHNWEGGINFKFDNVLTEKGTLRAKVVVFSNKVDDYIDAVQGPNSTFGIQFQYQNIATAKLEGVEFEAMYDAKKWFLGIGAHRIRGTNEETGEGLLTVPADQITLTAGLRAFDEKLIAGTRVRFVAEQTRLPAPPPGQPAAILPSDGYAVVDLFGQYQFDERMTLNLNIDNLFDKNYRQFLDQSNSPGFNARVGLTVRVGVTPETVTAKE